MHRFTRTPASALCALALLSASGCGGSSKRGTSSSAAQRPPATAPAAPATSSSTTDAAPATSTPATPGAAAGPGTVRARSGPISATMRAGTHTPKANRPWPVHFVATDGGRPARASVDYEFVFAGQVVAHRSHYTFTGRFSDVVVWPTSAASYPLTFRAVVVAAGRTLNLDYPVRVMR